MARSKEEAFLSAAIWVKKYLTIALALKIDVEVDKLATLESSTGQYCYRVGLLTGSYPEAGVSRVATGLPCPELGQVTLDLLPHSLSLHGRAIG